MEPFARILGDGRRSATVCLDASCDVLYANAIWRVLLAPPGTEMEVGAPLPTPPIAAESAGRWTEFMRALREGDRSTSHFAQVRLMPDGSPHDWFALHAEPATGDRDTFLGWVVTATTLAVPGSSLQQDSMPGIGAWSWDLRSGKSWWSDEAKAIFDYPLDEQPPSYEEFRALIHPSDRDRVTTELERQIASASSIELRHRIVQSSGAVRFVHNQSNVYRDGEGNPRQLLGTVQDITAEVESQHMAARAGHALGALTSGSLAILRSNTAEEALEAAVWSAVASGGYPLAWIGMLDDAQDGEASDSDRALRIVAVAGPASEYADNLMVTWDDTSYGAGPGGIAIRERRSVVIDDTATDPRFAPWRQRAMHYGLGSVMSTPIIVGGRMHGVLLVYAAESRAFDAAAVSILEEFAEEIAIAHEHLASRARLDDALDGTVRVLAAAVETRDPYTAGHQAKVAELSEAIAVDMGMSPYDVRGLRLAALIHDVGKVAVPLDLLTRPGDLRETELALIREHARIGEELMSTVDLPWPIATIIGQHHERMDGTGYPRGLSGDELLLPSRIIMVADCLEAMGRDRPYRFGKGMESARDYVLSERGRGFDAEVVDSCMRVLDNGFSFGGQLHPIT